MLNRRTAKASRLAVVRRAGATQKELRRKVQLEPQFVTNQWVFVDDIFNTWCPHCRQRANVQLHKLQPPDGMSYTIAEVPPNIIVIDDGGVYNPLSIHRVTHSLSPMPEYGEVTADAPTKLSRAPKETQSDDRHQYTRLEYVVERIVRHDGGGARRKYKANIGGRGKDPKARR